MPCVEVSHVVRSGDAATIYRTIQDMESYPSFMPNVVSVKVVEQRDAETLTRWVTDVDGLRLSWLERDEFDDTSMQIRYCQTEGDLKKFSGAWRIEPEESGVRITLSVDFELGVPMIAGLINPLLKRKIRENCVGMLTALENEMQKSVASFDENAKNIV